MKYKHNSPYDEIALIGAGGTGGYIIPHFVRMISHLTDVLNIPDITVVDPDIVERDNCNRQNFLFSDIGRRKCEVLATRYSGAFGIPINYITEKLCLENISQTIDREGKRLLIIDAVDKKAPRNSIWKYVRGSNRVDWLSLGNTETYGQAVLYSKSIFGDKARSVISIYPDDYSEAELRKELEEERRESCAQNAVSKPQSIAINLTSANVAINILYQLLYDKEIESDFVLFDRFNNYKCVPVGVNPFEVTPEMEDEFTEALLNIAA